MAFLLILIDPVEVLSRKLCGVPWVIKFGFASKKFWLFENRPSVRPHLHVSECKMSHFMLDLSPRYIQSVLNLLLDTRPFYEMLF